MVLADFNRSSRPWQTRLIRFEKVAYQNVESIRVVPLHPVRTLIEDMQLGLRNLLKKQQRLIERSAVIIASPENQRLGLEVLQFVVERLGLRRVGARQLGVIIFPGAHLVALTHQFFSD